MNILMRLVCNKSAEEEKRHLKHFKRKKVSPPINIHLKSYILAFKSKVGQLCKYVQNWN